MLFERIFYKFFEILYKSAHLCYNMRAGIKDGLFDRFFCKGVFS